MKGWALGLVGIVMLVVSPMKLEVVVIFGLLLCSFLSHFHVSFDV